MAEWQNHGSFDTSVSKKLLKEIQHIPPSFRTYIDLAYRDVKLTWSALDKLYKGKPIKGRKAESFTKSKAVIKEFVSYSERYLNVSGNVWRIMESNDPQSVILANTPVASLPDNLKVISLDISGTKIIRLPKKLTVAHSLTMRRTLISLSYRKT